MSEGLLDGLAMSPFTTTLVLVASPTRLTLCDPKKLASALRSMDALRREREKVELDHNEEGSHCAGFLATVNADDCW
jgi:hypothetical protein